jgi:hypothetical protein
VRSWQLPEAFILVWRQKLRPKVVVASFIQNKWYKHSFILILFHEYMPTDRRNVIRPRKRRKDQYPRRRNKRGIT